MIYSFAIAFAVLFTATVVDTTDVSPKNDEEREILQFFSKWRNGDTLPFSLPPLDIIVIPPVNGSYSGKGIKLTYSCSEMHLAGVNNFTVMNLDVAWRAMRASGTLHVPSLIVTADNYELDGKAIRVYTLKGSGKLNVTLNNVILQFEIQLAQNGNGTRVYEMKFDFSIENIQANLENSSWPVNKLLNKEGVRILDRYHEEIIAATRATLVSTFDEYLATVTPDELLSKIKP